jgi:hypothetical protein
MILTFYSLSSLFADIFLSARPTRVTQPVARPREGGEVTESRLHCQDTVTSRTPSCPDNRIFSFQRVSGRQQAPAPSDNSLVLPRLALPQQSLADQPREGNYAELPRRCQATRARNSRGAGAKASNGRAKSQVSRRAVLADAGGRLRHKSRERQRPFGPLRSDVKRPRSRGGSHRCGKGRGNGKWWRERELRRDFGDGSRRGGIAVSRGFVVRCDGFWGLN